MIDNDYVKNTIINSKYGYKRSSNLTLPVIQNYDLSNTINTVFNCTYPMTNLINHNELLNIVGDISDVNFDTLQIFKTKNEYLKIEGTNKKQTQALKKETCETPAALTASLNPQVVQFFLFVLFAFLFS